MIRRIFDIETNGLLNAMDRIHCLVIRDTDTGQTWRCNDQPGPTLHPTITIKEGLEQLLEADQIIGHNVIKYDIPAIQIVHPWFKPEPKKVLDTLVYSRLVYPDLIDIDTKLLKKEKLPRHLFKSQSLDAWGHRLGKFKGDYAKQFKEKFIAEHGEKAWKPAMEWAAWSPEMEDYCVVDTEVTQALLDKLDAQGFAEESVKMEMAVANIVARQERHGFLFDMPKAVKLYSTLVARKLEVEATLMEVFKPLYRRDGAPMVPKRDNKGMGYLKDAPFQKLKLMEFNPASRDHIAFWLKRRYGWEPTEFTDDGKPKIDETVLSQLKYPEAKPLKEYLMLEKRIGQISEGKEAWMKKVASDGRIHGSVITNGAVTGRMTHSSPNMAQVPAGYSLYGPECRELFCVPEGKVLVGADAAALELRDLAGYMAAYDGGEYVTTVLEGDKKLGTDIHSVNARAIGLDPKGTYFDGESGRDIAKTWFYAFIYGAGDGKLGFIMTRKKNSEAVGKKSRDKFMKNLPALGKLVERVKKAVKERGHLKGLDGRILKVRSSHSALNTLLQSAGAVQMKMALVILDNNLQSLGYLPGVHYEFVANVHDEWQIECDKGLGETVGKQAVEAIRLAGERFRFRCPLDGEYCVGSSWAETH